MRIRRLFPWLTALVLCASPAYAQTKDQLHQRTELDSLTAAYGLTVQVDAAVARACAVKSPAAYMKAVCSYPKVIKRLVGSAMRTETTFVALYIPVKDTQVVVAPPDTQPAPPPPADTSKPPTLGLNIAAVAELPRATVNTTYPATLRDVRVPLIANLQTYLNNALPGDNLLLPQGSSYTGDFMLPKHACTAGAVIVLRTDAPDSVLGAPGIRMTPGRAATARLAKLTSPDNQQAIGTAPGSGAGCWRLVGLEVTGTSDANGLVRFGDPTNTPQGSNLILDRSYVHGGPIRRCVILNSGAAAIIDSWLSQCFGPNGDTQAVLGYNGTGPYVIRNNELSGGTEVIMWGGADPAVPNLVPSDIWILGNHVTRPITDKGLPTIKNLLETKNARRMLVSGNVFENNWVAGQVGFALLLKSVNQDGNCPWCTTQDITVQDNLIQKSGSGINIAGIPQGPAIGTARILIQRNTFDSLNVGVFNGDGIPWQVLGGALNDVIFSHNTVRPASWGWVSVDGVTQRVVFQDNLAYCGGYGIKGGGVTGGTPTLAALFPGYGWAGNALTGCSSGYPAGTVYNTTAGVTTTDGRPVGAP